MADRKKKKTSAGCNEPFSPWHRTDGKFANPDDEPAGSWSCAEKGQTSRRGRSKRYTKVPCGRKARAQNKDVRCHDGKVLHSELYNKIKTLVEEELAIMRRDGEDFNEFERLHIPTLKQSFEEQLQNNDSGLLDEQDCSQCIQNYVQSLNAAIRASKGDLGKKQ